MNRFWLERSVFVTGAMGFLGSWLTRALHQRGARVVVLSRDQNPLSNYHFLGLDQQVTVVRGELEDRDLVERVLNEYEVDTCFHLAAQSLVTTAERNPLSTFRSNVEGTWNLLESTRRSPLLKRLVVASTDKAYGDAPRLPYTENMPLAARFPYDVSKVCVDLLSQCYFHTYGSPVVVVRCGNLYGGGDLNYDRLIPGTIRSILEGTPPIVRSDGTFKRDFFYVQDAVEAFLLLGERAQDPGVAGEAFNFATGQGTKVLDVVRMLLEIGGRADLKPRIENRAKAEIREQVLSTQKARERLGWRPRTSLREGLAETWAWFSRYQDRLRIPPPLQAAWAPGKAKR